MAAANATVDLSLIHKKRSKYPITLCFENILLQDTVVPHLRDTCLMKFPLNVRLVTILGVPTIMRYTLLGPIVCQTHTFIILCMSGIC